MSRFKTQALIYPERWTSKSGRVHTGLYIFGTFQIHVFIRNLQVVGGVSEWEGLTQPPVSDTIKNLVYGLYLQPSSNFAHVVAAPESGVQVY